MTFKTKMRFNAGSMLTVIPKGIVDLLQLKQGDTVEWDVDITETGATIQVKIPGKTPAK